jgi:hypothetical protein
MTTAIDGHGICACGTNICGSAGWEAGCPDPGLLWRSFGRAWRGVGRPIQFDRLSV